MVVTDFKTWCSTRYTCMYFITGVHCCSLVRINFTPGVHVISYFVLVRVHTVHTHACNFTVIVIEDAWSIHCLCRNEQEEDIYIVWCEKASPKDESPFWIQLMAWRIFTITRYYPQFENYARRSIIIKSYCNLRFFVWYGNGVGKDTVKTYAC